MRRLPHRCHSEESAVFLADDEESQRDLPTRNAFFSSLLTLGFPLCLCASVANSRSVALSYFHSEESAVFLADDEESQRELPTRNAFFSSLLTLGFPLCLCASVANSRSVALIS